MKPVTFYFDFASPYSYLANTQTATLPGVVRRAPIAVLELMKLVNNVPTSVTCPAKRAYAGRDLGRWAARYGAPFAMANFGALNFDLLLRLAIAGEGLGVGARVTDRIFQAVWGGQGDASPAGVEIILAEAGLPVPALVERAEAAATAKALEDNIKEAATAGVFGAPTFVVGEELFFGNDRMDFVRAALGEKREVA